MCVMGTHGRGLEKTLEGVLILGALKCCCPKKRGHWKGMTGLPEVTHQPVVTREGMVENQTVGDVL